MSWGGMEKFEIHLPQGLALPLGTACLLLQHNGWLSRRSGVCRQTPFLALLGACCVTVSEPLAISGPQSPLHNEGFEPVVL